MTDRELMQQALDALELVTARMLDCRDELAERGGRPQTNLKHQDLWDLAFLAYTETALPIASDLRARLAQPEPEPQLTQRNGNCLLTGVCAAEGHRITKEKSDQTPIVWMYQDKSTNEVKFQKEMRAFVDHGATYEFPLYAAPQPKEIPYDPSENNKDYERWFIDGMQHQMKSSVDIAVNAMANQQKTSGSLITEPVGRFAKFADGVWKEVTNGSAGQPLYTAPPQREWQGLTQHDIDIAFDDTQEGGGFDDFARAIEAKLKEKNA